MNFATLYRVSFYAMLFFATLVLSVDATDSRVRDALPGRRRRRRRSSAFLTVDRNPRPGLSRPARSNVLALALGRRWCSSNTRHDADLLLLALGHWLVYLQLIMMFLPKTVRTTGPVPPRPGAGAGRRRHQPERHGRAGAVRLGGPGALGARPLLAATATPSGRRRGRARPARRRTADGGALPGPARPSRSCSRRSGSR